MSAKGAKKSRYCKLMQQYLELSKEKAELESTLSKQELSDNSRYVKLDKKIKSIEAQLDRIINEFEHSDFKAFFQRLDNDE